MQKPVIVAVGSTGTGKSTMAKYLTGSEDVVVGHRHESETRRTTLHDLGEFNFIDTPGFLDSDKRFRDEEVRVAILRFLHDKSLTSITTILWFCNPNVRADKILKEQAEFIKSLEDEERSASIWENVIIILKKGDDSEGPLNAHESLRDRKSKPAVRSLYIMDENNSLLKVGKLLGNERFNEGYLYRSELQDWVKKVIEDQGHKEKPYQITFYDDLCTKCGLKTDHRLMDDAPCHDILTKVHKGNPQTVHIGNLENYHPGHLYDNGSSGVRIGPISIGARKRFVHSCCGWEMHSSGCKKKHNCCGRPEGQVGCTSQYSECLCSRDAEGCTSVCRDCSKEYGTSGCGKHTHEIEYSTKPLENSV